MISQNQAHEEHMNKLPVQWLCLHPAIETEIPIRLSEL